MTGTQDTATLVVWRHMRREGCNEWEETGDGAVVIRFRCEDGRVAYARGLSAAEAVDSYANRAAGDARRD